MRRSTRTSTAFSPTEATFPSTGLIRRRGPAAGTAPKRAAGAGRTTGGTTEGHEQILQAGEVRSARVESLRALAALGVFTAHAYGLANQYSVTTLDTALSRLPFIGTMGVVMFFSLTGYLLFWPFVKRIFETGERINLKQYALNRAFRILPLYFFAVTLLMFLKGGGSIGEWLRWATFTTNFDVSLLDLDGPLWSVSVEIHYYILLPFLAFAIGWLARGSLARAALVLFVLGAASFAVALALIEPGVASTAGKTLPGKFFYFVPGMLVALLRLHWQRHPPTYLRGPLASTDLWLGAAIVIMILQAFQVHYFLGDLREFNKFPDYTVAFFLIVGACVLPLKPGLLTRCLEWRALAMLGVASYSFYVWHHPILAAIAGRQQWPVLEFFALTLPLAIVVAFVSYYGVESPFLRLRGKWASSAPSHVAREPATSPESPPPADSKEAPEEGETADARRGDAPAVAGVRGSEPPA